MRGRESLPERARERGLDTVSATVYPLGDVVGVACPNGEYVAVKGDS